MPDGHKPAVSVWKSDRESGRRTLTNDEADLLVALHVAGGSLARGRLGLAQINRGTQLERDGLVIDLDGQAFVLADLGWEAAEEYMRWDPGLRAAAARRLEVA